MSRLKSKTLILYYHQSDGKRVKTWISMPPHKNLRKYSKPNKKLGWTTLIKRIKTDNNLLSVMGQTVSQKYGN